jgi:hypothetical protein
MEIGDNGLDQYFIFPGSKTLDMDEVARKMKGPKYKKMMNSYIFQKK